MTRKTTIRLLTCPGIALGRRRIILFALLVFCAACPAGAASSSHGRTIGQLRGISVACEAFRTTYGSYPSGSNLLAELTGSDAALVNTRRIHFVAKGTMAITDAWGNAFVYRCPGTENPDSFDLYSLGADGKTASGGNDPDDINNWNVEQPWLAHYEPAPIAEWGLVIMGVVLAMIFCFGFIRQLLRKHGAKTGEELEPAEGKK